MDLNKVAKYIAEVEGKKESISIAQVKEVLRIVLTHFELLDLVKMWIKINKR